MYSSASRAFLRILLTLLLSMIVICGYAFCTLVAFERQFNTAGVVYVQPNTSLENIFNALIANDKDQANHTESITNTNDGGVELVREAQVITSDEVYTIQYVTGLFESETSNVETKHVLLTIEPITGADILPVMSYADIDVDGTVDIVYSNGEIVGKDTGGLTSQEAYTVALDTLATLAVEMI